MKLSKTLPILLEQDSENEAVAKDKFGREVATVTVSYFGGNKEFEEQLLKKIVEFYNDHQD